MVYSVSGHGTSRPWSLGHYLTIVMTSPAMLARVPTTTSIFQNQSSDFSDGFFLSFPFNALHLPDADQHVPAAMRPREKEAGICIAPEKPASARFAMFRGLFPLSRAGATGAQVDFTRFNRMLSICPPGAFGFIFCLTAPEIWGRMRVSALKRFHG